MNKKALALLLALSVLPTVSLATYEPDASTWQWYESTPRIGYFMSKQSPVYKLSETDDTLVLRGNIQTVFAEPRNGIKFSLRNVKVTYDKITGERYFNHIILSDYDENQKLISRKTNLPTYEVQPGTMAWRITEAILKTYNAQEGK